MPNEIQCVAVLDGDGDVAAVLSLLDRVSGGSGSDASGGQRALAAVVDLAAALLAEAAADDTDMTRGLARFAPNERTRVAPIVHAVLGAFER